MSFPAWLPLGSAVARKRLEQFDRVRILDQDLLAGVADDLVAEAAAAAPALLDGGGASRSSAPAEQPLDVAELELHVGRPAVVALAGIGRRLHFA